MQREENASARFTKSRNDYLFNLRKTVVLPQREVWYEFATTREGKTFFRGNTQMILIR